MRDINKTLEAYYTQFEKLFTLRETYGIDTKFFKKALKGFMKQFLYDLRYIRKIRRKLARKWYKENLDELLAEAEETAIQAVEVVKRVVSEEEPKKIEQEPSKELARAKEAEVPAVTQEAENRAVKPYNEAEEVEDLTEE